MNQRKVESWRPDPSAGKSRTLEWISDAFVGRVWLFPALLSFVAILYLVLCETFYFSGAETGTRMCLELIVVAILICAVWLLTVLANRFFERHASQWETHEYADALPRLRVWIDFEVGGHLYGKDRGELTLIEDWLIFEGSRTSFAISPSDVALVKRSKQDIAKDRVAVNLTDTGASVQLRITSDEIQRDPSMFLETWMMVQDPPVGVSVLPPLEPMPGLQRWRLPNKVRNQLFIVFWITFILCLMAISGGNYLSWFVFAFVLVTVTATSDSLLGRKKAFRLLDAANEELREEAPPIVPEPGPKAFMTQAEVVVGRPSVETERVVRQRE